MSAAPTRFVQARGRVAVWELGEGSPVLLLHGFPDHPVGMLAFAERIAAAGHRVVVPALPGYRPSDPAPDGDYALARVAEDMLAVARELGLERPAVVGHDWGAEVAYRLGANAPEAVSRIVALSAPHPAGFAARRALFAEQQTAFYALFLAFAPGAAAVACDPRWLTSLVHLAAPALYREDWPAILAEVADEETLAEVCRWYRCDLLSDEPPQPVRVPATVVYGSQDAALRPVLFRGLERWFEAGLDAHELPGAGHWPQVEEPERVAALVLDALARKPAADA